MATTVTDPYATLADVVAGVILAEFDGPDDGKVKIYHDKIHGSLGTDGATHIGIYPTDQPSYGITTDIGLKVQFYGPFEKMVNPNQSVDPRRASMKAARLRYVLQAERVVGTSDVWYFDVGTVEFPPDPTGNMSRFEMQITAKGENSGLVETCA